MEELDKLYAASLHGIEAESKVAKLLTQVKASLAADDCEEAVRLAEAVVAAVVALRGQLREIKNGSADKKDVCFKTLLAYISNLLENPAMRVAHECSCAAILLSRHSTRLPLPLIFDRKSD